MTQEEILQYNKRCAEFLGYKCSINEQYELPNMMTFPPKGMSNLCHTAKVCCIEDMQFHSDWNWIMEVVEDIEKIFHIQGVEINGKWCCIKTNTFHEYRGVNKKEAVVEAINQFLIWYEQNKTI